ncbi:hypothetical protein C1646_769459 [Rhizophagus diaphanus]|nr:hypothetical protein C1646_769459 [Rhizophagus diaphanus] [Rhizophagus sp. MUCL 43196]
MSVTLLCLVKGNTLANAFSVKISRDEPVSELKKAIKAEKQNDFDGVDADELKLWKFEKPPKKHIHVIVEPPATSRNFTLSHKIESEDYGQRVRLNNEGVNRFWGVLASATCEKFLKLPGNIRFLGKEQGPSALFIRKCYLDLEDVVFDNKITKLRITGNPGIGKTYFGYYLLYLLALRDVTVVYDNHKESNPIVFESGKNAFISNSEMIKLYLQKSKVWYIVDGKEPKSVDAKTILICSPKRDYYKKFDNYEGVVTARFMPIWSWEEIKKCRKGLYNDEVEKKLAKDLFLKWGGIPRYVLEKAKDITSQQKLDDAILDCDMDIFKYIGESSVERTTTSHMIVHNYVNLPVSDDDELNEDELNQCTPDQLKLDRYGDPPYTKTILRFASNYVRKRVTEQLEENIRARLRKFDVRPLDEYDDGDANDADAKVDLEKNFPSLDSVIAPNRVFQMTVSKVHPIKMNGLKLLYDKFGGNSADHLIYYYFVVPERIYDKYEVQKFVNSKDDPAQIIPAWIKERIFQYVLKIKS